MQFVTLSLGDSVVLTLPSGQEIEVKIGGVRVPMHRDGRYAALIGVKADRSIPIHRLEVQDAIDAGRSQGAESI